MINKNWVNYFTQFTIVWLWYNSLFSQKKLISSRTLQSSGFAQWSQLKKWSGLSSWLKRKGQVNARYKTIRKNHKANSLFQGK